MPPRSSIVSACDPWLQTRGGEPETPAPAPADQAEPEIRSKKQFTSSQKSTSAAQMDPTTDALRNRHRRVGFTLIELLVVIAIVAILASLLLPALARAKQSALRAACQSALHQIAVAQLMYSQDFRELLPPCIVDEGRVTQDSWDAFLQPYVVSKAPQPSAAAGGSDKAPVDRYVDIFACPADKRDRAFGRKRSYSRVLPDNQLYANEWVRIFFQAVKVDTVTRTPIETAYLSEWHSKWNVRRMNWPGNFIDAPSYNQGAPAYRAAGERAPRFINHAGRGSNFSFYDGHVSWLTPPKAGKATALLWPVPLR
ncbi:MAG: prepilin-type N-terminal cleavage/methylation domain-containing protein [Chloroflexi bacterium]|nr:prepilin-type N-terminal cleavage/methylation domain-containing protein [Chloroflexota bacterium]